MPKTSKTNINYNIKTGARATRIRIVNGDIVKFEVRYANRGRPAHNPTPPTADELYAAGVELIDAAREAGYTDVWVNDA